MHADVIVCGCAWEEGFLVAFAGGDLAFLTITNDDPEDLETNPLVWADYEGNDNSLGRIVHLQRRALSGEDGGIVYGMNVDGLPFVLRIEGGIVHVVNRVLPGGPLPSLVSPGSCRGTGVTDTDFAVQMWDVTASAKKFVMYYRFDKAQSFMSPEGGVQRYFSPLLVWEGGDVEGFGGDDCPRRIVVCSGDLVENRILGGSENGEVVLIDLIAKSACTRLARVQSPPLAVEWIAGLCYVFLCTEVVVIDLLAGVIAKIPVPLLGEEMSPTSTSVYRPLARFNPLLNFQRKLAQVPVNPAITESLLRASLRGEDEEASGIQGFVVQGKKEGIVYILRGKREYFFKQSSVSAAALKFYNNQWVSVGVAIPDGWFPLGGWFCDGVRLFRELGGDWVDIGPDRVLFCKNIGSARLIVAGPWWRFEFEKSVQVSVDQVWMLPLPLGKITGIVGEKMVLESALGRLEMQGHAAEWVSAGVNRNTSSDCDVESVVQCAKTGHTLVGDREGKFWVLDGSRTIFSYTVSSEPTGKCPVSIVPLSAGRFVVYSADTCCVWENSGMQQVQLGARIRHVFSKDPDSFYCLLEPGTELCRVHLCKDSQTAVYELKMDFEPYGEIILVEKRETSHGMVHGFTLARYSDDSGSLPFETALVSFTIEQPKIGALFPPDAVQVSAVLPFEPESEEPVSICLWEHRIFSTLIVVGTKGTVRGRVLLFDRNSLTPISKTSVPSKEVSAVEPVSDLVLAVGGSESIVIIGLEENGLLYTIDVYQTFSNVKHVTAIKDIQGILVVTSNGCLVMLALSKDNVLTKAAVVDSERHVVSKCVLLGKEGEHTSRTFVCSSKDGTLLRYSVRLHHHELILIDETPLGVGIASSELDPAGNVTLVTEKGTLLNFSSGILLRDSS